MLKRIKTILLPLLLTASSLPIYSQTVSIEVNVLQSIANEAYLYHFSGGRPLRVDSTISVQPGVFHFALQPGYSKGLYRVRVGGNIKLNFIVADEPRVDINTVVYAPEDSLRSNSSLENNIYWDFQRIKKDADQKQWLIRSLMDFYPDSLLFHQLLYGELIEAHKTLYSYADSISSANPNLLASKIIRMELLPVASTSKGVQDLNALTDLWWSNQDLHSIPIANSPGFNRRLWGYIEQLMSDDFDKEEQDNAFINGITSLLTIDMDPQVRIMLRDLVIEGMQGTDYQEVAEHFQIVTLADLQPLVEGKPDRKQRKSAPKIRVGETAYDFYINTVDGNRTKLSKVDADYKLILFWSTWCKYCMEIKPELIELYREYIGNGLEVISICIDDELEPWQTMVNRQNAGWVEVREPYLIDAPLFKMFDVHETPKMFLLSKDLTILSRPVNIRQLEVRLRRLVR